MRRSEFNQVLQPEFFFWATGIEDTFITEPWPDTGRTLDEYELTGHYQRWREDLDLVADLGVSHVRYGIPWHLIQPDRNVWHWEFADKTLNYLIEREIEPVVDLVHYGLPRWIDQAWLHPDFPKFMAEYVARAAERFKGRIHLWTPLNEPRITAWYCGKLGWWPPFRRGWGGFLQVMLGVARGIALATRVLREVDSENIAVHVDATDLYESPDPALAGEVERRQEIVFLALDLVSGRVQEGHSLYSWLLANGVTRADLEWFQVHAVDLEIIGINLYPLFSKKILTRAPHLRLRMPYAGAEIVEQLAVLYHQRYGSPVFISETASLGSVKRRAAWLSESVAAVRRVRARGIPLVGYTWWPLFALVTWAYRQGTQPVASYLRQMGLWDLAPEADGSLPRVLTPLVDQFKTLIADTPGAVGRLETAPSNKRLVHVS